MMEAQLNILLVHKSVTHVHTCTHTYTNEDIAISHLYYRVAMFLEMIGFDSTALQMFLDVGISLKK